MATLKQTIHPTDAEMRKDERDVPPTGQDVKAESPSPELVLACRFKREIAKAARRSYNRAVREFAEDASCTEEAAKSWLATIGVTEPTNGNGSK